MKTREEEGNVKCYCRVLSGFVTVIKRVIGNGYEKLAEKQVQR